MLELYLATKDADALSRAERGASHIIATTPDEPGPWQVGLYVGAAGSAFVWLQLYRITGQARYRDAAVKQISIIEHSASPGPSGGLTVAAANDILSGSAGIITFLLDAVTALDDARPRELAARIGVGLLGKSQAGVPRGKRWLMSEGDEFAMPNFSHGTAGVAYALARLYRETKREEFLAAALAGAEHLTAIATTTGDTCLIPHYMPGGDGRYYLAWCHGPAGTARLFYELHRLTGDQKWQTWFFRSVRGVLHSGIPDLRTPGFWDNVGQCCGSAGVAEFLVSLYQITGEEHYLQFAHRVTADILARGRPAGDGTEWIHAENRTEPYWKQSFTGYMQGAAGIGSLLLRLAAIDRGKQWKIHLPDNPFPV